MSSLLTRHTARPFAAAGCAALLVLGAVLLAAALRLDGTRTAYANSDITVDTDEGFISDNNACSLPEAIANANNDAAVYDDCAAGTGTDRILFDAGLNGATIALSDTLVITDNLSIEGPGAPNLTISGNDTVGVMYVNSLGIMGSLDVTIDGLHIADGLKNVGGGAGILNTERLTVSNSLLSNNRASNATGDGGGILNTRDLTVISSTISANESGRNGGGIGNIGGTLAISNSTIMSNTASQDGGGMYALGGTWSVVSTTIMTNVASLYGGGVAGESGNGTIESSTITNNENTLVGGGVSAITGTILSIRNSTISGNYVTTGGEFGGGPAIYLANADTSVTLVNSTVVNNNAPNLRDGIWQDEGRLTLDSSIIANNGTNNNFSLDVPNKVTSAGYNLTNSPAVTFSTQPTDQIDTQALLGPLTDNGGPTQTHWPLQGSPAINAIPAAECSVTTDQRGFPRPIGGACDIGAVEVPFWLYLPIIIKAP
jgi:hypothetical protein